MEEVPIEVRILAKSVVAIDLTCWFAILILIILYGLKFVVL